VRVVGVVLKEVCVNKSAPTHKPSCHINGGMNPQEQSAPRAVSQEEIRHDGKQGGDAHVTCLEPRNPPTHPLKACAPFLNGNFKMLLTY
jgi:hypothetical protein